MSQSQGNPYSEKFDIRYLREGIKWHYTANTKTGFDNLLKDKKELACIGKSPTCEIKSQNAADFAKMLKVVKLLESRDNLEVSIFDSRACYSNSSIQKVSVKKLKSLVIRYDNTTKHKLSGDRQFFEFLDDLSLQSLTLDNVPVTRALEDLFGAQLIELTLVRYQQGEFHNICRMLQELEVDLLSLKLKHAHVAEDFPALKNLQSLEFCSLSDNSISNFLQHSPVQVSWLTVDNPKQAWFSKPRLPEVLGDGCLQLEYLHIYRCNWFNYAMYQRLCQLWHINTKAPLEEFLFDEKGGLKIEAFSDVYYLNDEESSLAKVVTQVPENGVDRLVHRLVSKGSSTSKASFGTD